MSFCSFNEYELKELNKQLFRCVFPSVSHVGWTRSPNRDISYITVNLGGFGDDMFSREMTTVTFRWVIPATDEFEFLKDGRSRVDLIAHCIKRFTYHEKGLDTATVITNEMIMKWSQND